MGPLLDQLAKLVAVHDELQSAHQELLAERNGVRDELESTHSSLSRTNGELEAIRAAATARWLPMWFPRLSARVPPLGADLKALHGGNSDLVSALSEYQRSIIASTRKCTRRLKCIPSAIHSLLS